MKEQLPGRFWVETALAVASAALLALTLISRSWIETVFKVDPDQSSGSLEYLIVGATLAVTVFLVALASREWRRRNTAIA